MNIFLKAENDYQTQNRHTLKRIPIFLVAMLLSFGSANLIAQDIHFAQFHNSPLRISPALTGVFDGDVRFIANYRNQWQSVPVTYMTLSGTYDMKFPTPRGKKGYFAGGLVFDYDQAGQSKLHLASFGLNSSYTIELSQRSFLGFGAQLSLNQRGFNLTDLSFDNQYDGLRYNPNIDPKENFNNTSIFFADLAGGLNYRLQSTKESKKRHKLDLGFAMYHITEPNMSFQKNSKVSSSLQQRFSIYGLGTIMIKPKFDLLIYGMRQIQGPYREASTSLAGKIHLNEKRGKKLALVIGGLFRFDFLGDAAVPMIEVHYNYWQVGVSYDINVSNFNEATNYKGGPEFSIQYLLHKVKPLPEFKICPII